MLNFFVNVLSWQSIPDCPFLSSCPGSPFLAITVWLSCPVVFSSHSNPCGSVPAVIPGCPVLPSFPVTPILADLFRLSFLAVLSCRLFQSLQSWWFCSGCHYWLSCPAVFSSHSNSSGSVPAVFPGFPVLPSFLVTPVLAVMFRLSFLAVPSCILFQSLLSWRFCSGCRSWLSCPVMSKFC
jgi:hypothetical protein